MLNIKTRDSWQFIEPHPEGDQYPCWSTNGEEIVWTHGNQLWISDSKDSKNARPLTTTAAKAFEYCGDWDPSGEWIAYIAAYTHDGSKGYPYKIWLIRPNGKDQKLLHGGISALHLKWSRDGQFIYFSNGSSLMRVNVRGKCNIDKVFDFNNPYDVDDFDISPDGREVVFSDTGAKNSGTIHVGNLSKEFPWQYRSLTRPSFIISGSDSPTYFKLSNGQCFLYKDYIVHTFPQKDDRGDDIRIAIKPNGQTIDNMVDPKQTIESFGLINVPRLHFLGLSGHHLFTINFSNKPSTIQVYNLHNKKMVFEDNYDDSFKIIGDNLLFTKFIGSVKSIEECPEDSRPDDLVQIGLAEEVSYDFKRETEVYRKKICRFYQ